MVLLTSGQFAGAETFVCNPITNYIELADHTNASIATYGQINFGTHLRYFFAYSQPGSIPVGESVTVNFYTSDASGFNLQQTFILTSVNTVERNNNLIVTLLPTVGPAGYMFVEVIASAGVGTAIVAAGCDLFTAGQILG